MSTTLKEQLKALVDAGEKRKLAEEAKSMKGDRDEFVTEVTDRVTESVAPMLDDLLTQQTERMDAMSATLEDAIALVKPNVNVTVPDVIVPEIVMPEFPKVEVPEPKVTVNVDNSGVERAMNDILDAISNQKPPVVTVKEPKVTVNTDSTQVVAAVKEVRDEVAASKVENVGLRDYGPGRPLPVVLTDDKGAAYVASAGGGKQSITRKIMDSGGAIIDPATAENQETINASQASQIALETTLNSLVETLQELIQRLAPLAGAVANTAQLRVVQTSVPSTAVTGPITSALSIAEKAVGGIMYAEKMAITNNTAIQSNISNVVIS